MVSLGLLFCCCFVAVVQISVFRGFNYQFSVIFRRIWLVCFRQNTGGAGTTGFWSVIQLNDCFHSEIRLIWLQWLFERRGLKQGKFCQKFRQAFSLLLLSKLPIFAPLKIKTTDVLGLELPYVGRLFIELLFFWDWLRSDVTNQASL